MMHSLNGNKQKDKALNHQRLVTINKGYLNFKMYEHELKKVIIEKKADEVTIKTSNLVDGDSDAIKPFKGNFKVDKSLFRVAF